MLSEARLKRLVLVGTMAVLACSPATPVEIQESYKRLVYIFSECEYVEDAASPGGCSHLGPFDAEWTEFIDRFGPEYVEAWGARGAMDHMHGNYETAVAGYSKALELIDDGGRHIDIDYGVMATAAMILLRRGGALESMGRCELALEDYRRASALCESIWCFTYTLAQARAEIACGDVHHAVAILEDSQPGVWMEYYDRADTWESIGERTRARDDWNQALAQVNASIEQGGKKWGTASRDDSARDIVGRIAALEEP